ncbi:mitochondrial sodium/calcium exchanger protein [Drosophila hydei]|uniref:Mitochondrial sodium/calcium exchanger protein n=1 Tax=Drosophila hydei TaxID=7224 RepID=A0A6J1LLL0_DROHY|nr:mitochondrial sodium/calcium exchanger protein [Drosophila hydei]
MAMLIDDFRYFMSNVSCHSLLRVSYKYRCSMARELEDCQTIINYFNYFELMYCLLRIHEESSDYFAIFLLLLAYVAYLLLMSIVVDQFFTPTVKILAMKLRLNEYLAGVTLLAFANSSPDFVANLMPIKKRGALFTCTIGHSLAVLLVCGGMICFLKPFQIDGHSTVQNLLFLTLAIELLTCIVFSGHRVTRADALVLLSFYGIFLIVNIADLLLIKHTIRTLRLELKDQRDGQAQSLENKKKLALLNDLEQNDVINFEWHRTHDADDFGMAILGSDSADYVAYRTILHSPSSSKNRLLFADLWDSLRPYDALEWQLGNCCQRLLIILKVPLLLLATLFVPVVDYGKHKHGWSKLLNCTQIVTNPFLIITAVHSKFASVYKSWYIDLKLDYSAWSFCLTVPLALFVFLDSRTDMPPRYHFFFITLSACSSLVLIVLCVGEIEILTSIVGAAFNLGETFVDITFGSLTNAIIDLLADFSLAMQGYDKMAFAAICAAPFFSIVVGLGVAFLFNSDVSIKGSTYWLYGEYGDNCYIFIMLAIFTQLWWCLTLNFSSRRSVGVFSWILYLLFLVYAIAAEFNLVHEFTRDDSFELQ